MSAVSRLMCALGLFALASLAQAQYHEYLPDAGTKEVDFSASINFTPHDSQNLNARAGYFLGRSLEVGLDGSYMRIKDVSTEHSWGIGGFANWHFPQSTPLLPYVGAFAGVSKVLGGDTWTSLGVQAGAKYFFNPNVAGFAEYRFRSFQFGSDQTGLFTGLSIFFK